MTPQNLKVYNATDRFTCNKKNHWRKPYSHKLDVLQRFPRSERMLPWIVKMLLMLRQKKLLLSLWLLIKTGSANIQGHVWAQFSQLKIPMMYKFC